MDKPRLILSSLVLLLATTFISGCKEGSVICVQYRVNWCGVCKAQELGFHAWGRAHNVDTVVLDITAQPLTVRELGIHKYPTYVLYLDGIEVSRDNNYSKLKVP